MPQDGQKLHVLKKTPYVQALYWKTETMRVEFQIQSLHKEVVVYKFNTIRHKNCNHENYDRPSKY